MYASLLQQNFISRCVETFTKPRPLVEDPGYDSDRREALDGLRAELKKGSIDELTIDIVERFARLPYCYTLQSCFGHFVSGPFTKDRNVKRVADLGEKDTVLHYRIAYVALCIQDSARGRLLMEELRAIPDTDPDYIQFGGADWFWNTSLNSYVLQVSPLRHAYEDHFDVDMKEAMRIEQARDRFFNSLRDVLSENERR